MSVLLDFFTTDSIRLDPISLDIVEPPRVLGVAVIDGGPTTREVPCINKRVGTLDVTLVILGLSIPFTGRSLGEDSMGRTLIRWQIDDRTPRPFPPTTIRRIRGQITMALSSISPFRTDLPNCSGAASEYFVRLAMVAPEELEERFVRLPNEIRLEADGITDTRALITGVQGSAGVTAPPPAPWPQPHFLSLSTHCVSSARATGRVFGELRLHPRVQRAHTGFAAVITAEAQDPVRLLTVNQTYQTSTSVFFEVLLPPDLTGNVQVTGYTNDRAQAKSDRFSVGGFAGLGCGGIFEEKFYEPIRIGCEAYDCGWTGLNDLAELIGRSNGWATRYLTSRRMIDGIGLPGGDKAFLRSINNYGSVLGQLYGENGKTDSFLWLEERPGSKEKTGLFLVKGAFLQALNDEAMAVGYRMKGKRMVPVHWVSGELNDLKIPGAGAAAMAVAGGGTIAGIYLPKAKGPVHLFSLGEKGFRDLGSPGAVVVNLAMNASGALAGTARMDGGMQGFVYADQTGLFSVKLPKGGVSGMLNSISQAGIAVGTFWGKDFGSARAFRYTAEKGSEDLNGFVDPKRNLELRSAIAINSNGQILVQGNEKGVPGFYLLNPASIPTPQIPIP